MPALMLMLVLVLELMLMPKEILKIESRLKITPLMEGRCEAEKIGNEDFSFPLARAAAAAARSHHRFGFDATCNETEWSSAIASSIFPPFPSVLCLLLRHRAHSKIEILVDLVDSGFVSFSSPNVSLRFSDEFDQ